MEEKSNTFLLYSRKIELIQPYSTRFFEQNLSKIGKSVTIMICIRVGKKT